MGTMKGWETRRKLVEAHDEAMKAAGAAVERERVRKLVETLAFPVTGETHERVAVLGFGRTAPLIEANELLRRLEEKPTDRKGGGE